MEARPMAGFLFYKWKPARWAGLLCYKCKPARGGELVMQNDNVERRDCLVLR